MEQPATTDPTASGMPMLGLGTWQNDGHEQCAESVRTALELGYRHVDTAQAYGNEAAGGGDPLADGRLVPVEPRRVDVSIPHFEGRGDGLGALFGVVVLPRTESDRRERFARHSSIQ